jgi:hypothetical protein
MLSDARQRLASAFAPAGEARFVLDADYRLDLQKLSVIIGILAMAIPVVLVVGTVVGECPFDSISHYYYSRLLGGFFVIALAFVGTFLIAYRGESDRESNLANAAGLAAFAVAFFPTSGDGGCERGFSGRAFVTPAAAGSDKGGTHAISFELFRHADYVHYGAAIVVFVSMLIFCIVFTRIDDYHREGGTPDGAVFLSKIRRNFAYAGCGLAIFVCLLALGLWALITKYFEINLPFWDRMNLTFVFESIALIAFGIAWAVRGRVIPFFEDPRDREALRGKAGR